MKLVEDSEINPYSYSHLIFDKGAKTIHWRKDSLPSDAGKTRYPHLEV
jgi:hypothetical protein